MIAKRFGPLFVVALLTMANICGGPPNIPDKPTTSDTPLRGAIFACSTQTTDPNGRLVSYQFDWGDLSQSEWSEFVAGGTVFGDTHTYADAGPIDIKARAKAQGGGTSDWSEPLPVNVGFGEGTIRWSLTYTDPEEPEDSMDFSLNTFGIGDDGSAYIGCDYGRVIQRKAGGTGWKFPEREFDELFLSAPMIDDNGTIYVTCDNDSIYAINSDGTQKWRMVLDAAATATPALGSDGTIYVQTEGDSLYALSSSGVRQWAFNTGGGKASPVIGTDGTVYVASQDGGVTAIPADGGNGIAKWGVTVGGQTINASPATDTDRGVLWVVDEDGTMLALALSNGGEQDRVSLGDEPGSPVLGADGTLYVGNGGKLTAYDPETRSTRWEFVPNLEGTASSAAVSDAGYIYFLVTTGKRDNNDKDSLYAVNPDGSYRWATGLYPDGYADDVWTSPKLDADGNIYVGNGLAAWCVVGIGGPAQSSWPMFQRDGRNTGRAR